MSKLQAPQGWGHPSRRIPKVPEPRLSPGTRSLTEGVFFHARGEWRDVSDRPLPTLLAGDGTMANSPAWQYHVLHRPGGAP